MQKLIDKCDKYTVLFLVPASLLHQYIQQKGNHTNHIQAIVNLIHHSFQAVNMKSFRSFKQQSELFQQIRRNLFTALFHQIQNRIGYKTVMGKAEVLSSCNLQHRFIDEGFGERCMGIVNLLCFKDSIRDCKIVVGGFQTPPNTQAP